MTDVVSFLRSHLDRYSRFQQGKRNLYDKHNHINTFDATEATLLWN